MSRQVSSSFLPSSLIIPTKNRPSALEDTLKSILEQTILPAEVIVIDQSKTGETREVVARISEAAKQADPTPPRFVYHYDPALNGAGPARNVAIELAICPILVFLDDDVLLDKCFLEEMLAVYAQHPEVGMVSGIIINYAKPSFREGLFERVFCIGPFRDERLPIYWNADALRNADPIPVRKMSGGVMSVSRTALGAERFDNNYCGRGEDVDFSWRISERCSAVLTPRARLIHVRTDAGRIQEHWITSVVGSYHYLYYRHWKSSLTNRLSFAWFNCGLVVVSAVSSIRQFSFVPFRALVAGIRASAAYRVTGSPAQQKLAAKNVQAIR